MRFFIYEFVTGGGWWSVDGNNPPSGSLLNEGSAMLQVLVRDFERLGSVTTLQDVRCRMDAGTAYVRQIHSAVEERICFQELTQSADWTIVIAPEFERHLQERCEWVTQS